MHTSPTNPEGVIQRLSELELLTPDQVRAVLASAQSPLRELINQGWVAEAELVNAASEVYALSCLRLADVPAVPVLGPAVLGTSDLAQFLHDQEALPIRLDGGVLHLAVVDPSNTFVVQVLRAKLGYDIERCLLPRSELFDALGRLYPLTQPRKHSLNRLADIQLVSPPESLLESDSGLVREVHRLIARAVSARASDIHFEPITGALRVRFRVNGLLRDVHSFSAEDAQQVVARIKLMAKLDVAEKRHAQNGRLRFPADGRLVDLRVSTLPLHAGESVVLRLLEVDLAHMQLTTLGFDSAIVEQLTEALLAQQGMVLVTGPTGSGKSTTLYALLNHLNHAQLKLVSIEDPVEIQIEGVNQIQVDDEHGLSFADALRSVLRQDPDVILVGEIRDEATAQLAAQAALTGHLVLATLHTSSAATTFARLSNLGLPDYLQAATVRTVLAQRLVRSLCTKCSLQEPQAQPTCSQCYGTGYAGRRLIAELIPFNVLQEIGTGAAAASPQAWRDTPWRQHLLQHRSLADDAQRLIALGVTDVVEVVRVLGTAALASGQAAESP